MNEPATERQLKFIEEICDVLDIPNPHAKTKAEASLFISENIAEYRYAIDEIRDAAGDFNGYIYLND